MATPKGVEILIKQDERERRERIDVGPKLNQVASAMCWYKEGYFDSDDEARGAFKLAYQQGLDGMGASTRAWMGMTVEQFDAWFRDKKLP